MKKMPRWKNLQPPYQIGKNDFTPKDLKKDYDGWVDPKIYLPISYDLVRMKMEHKTVNGWWNGLIWEGFRLSDDEVVVYWKFNEERKDG